MPRLLRFYAGSGRALHTLAALIKNGPLWQELRASLLKTITPVSYTHLQWMSSAEVTFMRIEIMIDKEQKISQSTLDALE